MANYNILAKFILSFEGGFSNHPLDKGGATNMGVTLKTWRTVGYDKDSDGDIDVDDLRLLTEDDVISKVFKPHYWDVCKGDLIRSQAVANIIVDWAWGSGTKTAIRNVQSLLKVDRDGILGPITLNAINMAYSLNLFNMIFDARTKFIENIVLNDSSQKVFLRGWMRRLNAINFKCLTANGGENIYF